MALGIFVLLIGLIFPTAIDASHTDATAGFELSEGENTTVTDGLRMAVESVEGDNATISLTDTQTRETESQTLTIGETGTYTTNGETSNVTVESINSNNVTTSTAEYSRTYGWGDGPKTFVDNLGLILAILAFLMGVGALAGVVL